MGLVEEGGGVYCVEGGFFGSDTLSPGLVIAFLSFFFLLHCYIHLNGEVGGGTNNLIESSCAFFGRISSINGSKPGYESRKFWRIPRCTEDLTLDFVLGAMLSLSMLVSFRHGG